MKKLIFLTAIFLPFLAAGQCYTSVVTKNDVTHIAFENYIYERTNNHYIGLKVAVRKQLDLAKNENYKVRISYSSAGLSQELKELSFQLGDSTILKFVAKLSKSLTGSEVKENVYEFEITKEDRLNLSTKQLEKISLTLFTKQTYLLLVADKELFLRQLECLSNTEK